MSDDGVDTVLRCYPQIYLSCHVAHRRAPAAPEGLSDRDSTVLAHLSEREPVTAAALARHPWRARLNGLAAAVLLLAVTAGGVLVTVKEWGYRMDPDELPMLEYISASERPGDVYLIPASVPRLSAGRGTPSTTFTPPPRRQPGQTLIPVDLQRFRLAAGAPIYVDFKSIPYKDTDVLEWYALLWRTEDLYKRLREGKVDEVIERMRQPRITHIVTTADLTIEDSRLKEVYADRLYRIYRLELEK